MSSHTLTINITLKLPGKRRTAVKAGSRSVWPPFFLAGLRTFDPDAWTDLSPRERAELKAMASGPTRL
ncbi:MAG: hypothetical protein QF477_11095 [SAR202 cluster bacterium]|nr:hypothetical protein [SAR202 cluster bacterium]